MSISESFYNKKVFSLDVIFSLIVELLVDRVNKVRSSFQGYNNNLNGVFIMK